MECPHDVSFSASSCFRCKVNAGKWGEFAIYEDATVEGGHAMQIVGWNDNYETEDNKKGVLILKNSWFDYPETSSHSVDHYLQKISLFDEMAGCPNYQDPINWQYGSILNDTLSPGHNNLVVYNFTQVPQEDLYSACLADATTGNIHYCATARPLMYWAYRFQPRTDSEKNDPDVCGYYAMSYYDITLAKKNFFMYAQDMTIQFSEQSYAANKAKYPNLDYSLIEASTHTQGQYFFPGFLPSNPGTITPNSGSSSSSSP
jgi:hypothetical protein